MVCPSSIFRNCLYKIPGTHKCLFPWTEMRLLVQLPTAHHPRLPQSSPLLRGLQNSTFQYLTKGSGTVLLAFGRGALCTNPIQKKFSAARFIDLGYFDAPHVPCFC